jgi:hypothetical protein
VKKLDHTPALTHSRPLARPAAFGFAEFLSPFPKRLKSPLGEGESVATSEKNLPLDLPCRQQKTRKRDCKYPLPGERITGEGGPQNTFDFCHRPFMLDSWPTPNAPHPLPNHTKPDKPEKIS